MFKRLILPLFLVSVIAVLSFQFSGCSTDDITNTIINATTVEVTAKDRLDSANAQAIRKYGSSTKLVLIMGKNVKANGKTELSLLSAATNPDSIGAWLYVYRAPSDTSLKIYTPNPLPTTSDCIELTAFFNTNQLLNLIQDTSAKNIISGALDLIISTNLFIATSAPTLLNSDASMNLASTTNPIIKFNNSYIPDTSSLNGNAFFSTGTNQTRNMILMPAAGTLNLPVYITGLTGFPADLWIVQYKKTNSLSQTESLILGTVVQSGQVMGVPLIGIQSPVINLSKYVGE
ncbi:MAG: hypothetical protein JNK43_09745 [Ignavibacteria bacterium]|nr:hypothetical protein [Ignavibacteria bacterium]